MKTMLSFTIRYWRARHTESIVPWMYTVDFFCGQFGSGK